MLNDYLPLCRALSSAALPLSLAMLLFVGSGIGCKDSPSASPATAPAAATGAMAKGEFQGVTFEYPADWKLTKGADGKGLNISTAADSDFEPNVYFEIQPTAAGQSLNDQIDGNIDWLRNRKSEIIVRSRTELDHPSGVRYGRIEFTNKVDAESAVQLQQWSVIMPMSDKQRLQVLAASASETWSKYEPTFAKIVDSIKLPK